MNACEDVKDGMQNYIFFAFYILEFIDVIHFSSLFVYILYRNIELRPMKSVSANDRPE